MNTKLIGLNIKGSSVGSLSQAMMAAINEGVSNGIEELAMMGVQIIIPLTPVNFGILAGSMQWQMVSGAPTPKAMIFAGPPADKYAAPVEFGTKPHFPPPSALLPWVKHKLGVSDEKQALSIAFAIAHAIAKRGTAGAQMFGKAIERLQQEALPVMEKNLAAAFVKHGFAGGAA